MSQPLKIFLPYKKGLVAVGKLQETGANICAKGDECKGRGASADCKAEGAQNDLFSLKSFKDVSFKIIWKLCVRVEKKQHVAVTAIRSMIKLRGPTGRAFQNPKSPFPRNANSPVATAPVNDKRLSNPFLQVVGKGLNILLFIERRDNNRYV